MAAQSSRSGDGPQPAEDPLVGATVAGRYQIVALMARGGMGKVYKAQQKALNRICALKILNAKGGQATDPQFNRRFSLEAATVSRLRHTNTVTIYDFGQCETTGVYFIAMEYLDGPTLSEVMRAEHAFPEARASAIAQQICRSVDEAHGIGIVHRDLKPGNVMLLQRGDESDFVKVLDFGLVKDVSDHAEELTQGQLFMGSPKYMSPEQVQSEKITAATDIYSLGIMLYEMLCGKTPFDAKGAKILVAHVSVPPIPLRQRNPDVSISEEMEAIVMRCIEKAPARRYSSMKDLRLALKAATESPFDTTESMTRLRSEVIVSNALPAPALPRPPRPHDAERETVPEITRPPNPEPTLANEASEEGIRRISRTTYAGIAVAAITAVGLVAVILGNRGEPPQLTKAPPSAEAPIGQPTAAAADQASATPPPPPTGKVHFEPVTESKNTEPAVFLSGRDPTYTREAFAGRVQGTAVARCMIRTNGTVTGCRMMKSLTFLDDEILSALNSRKFTPAKRFGHPVDEEYLFTVEMSLR